MTENDTNLTPQLAADRVRDLIDSYRESFDEGETDATVVADIISDLRHYWAELEERDATDGYDFDLMVDSTYAQFVAEQEDVL